MNIYKSINRACVKTRFFIRRAMNFLFRKDPEKLRMEQIIASIELTGSMPPPRRVK